MNVVKSKRKPKKQQQLQHTPFRYTRLHKIIWNYAHLFRHLFLFTARYNHNDLLIYIFDVVGPFVRSFVHFDSHSVTQLHAMPLRATFFDLIPSISHRSLKASSRGEFRFLAVVVLLMSTSIIIRNNFSSFHSCFLFYFICICTDYACLSASSLFACDSN